MNLSLPARRASPRIRRDLRSHLFAVGQSVRLRNGFGRLGPAANLYRVIATLPARGDMFQYRVRSDEERHERVVTEDSLERAPLSTRPEGATRIDATLIERTFGHGQRSEAQQSRNTKTEAGKGTAEG